MCPSDLQQIDGFWPEGVNPTPTFIAVLNYVRRSQGNLFITGRAGTGKSTLLRAIVKSLDGEVAISAPTGIAALNVGGETIHSLFRLPRGLLLDRDEFQASPRSIFEVPDTTLIIDEVSMVRADTLNAIDVSLREQREIDAPFCGVRVIAFGDTHQLPPVLRGLDEQRLGQAFGGAYFFHAPAARSMAMLELTEVFRQKDERFVALLNEIRDGAASNDALAYLNSRVGPAPRDDASRWVWVCATNDAANAVNHSFLGRIPGDARTYNATVQGEFERDARNAGRGDDATRLPADLALTLKVGARVIFIRNDRYRRWVNGTTGVVTNLADQELEVTIASDETITVAPDTWTKTRRVKAGKEIRNEEVGSMSQFPLRLGWAITIHKSQGMTLDRLFLNTPRPLFAPGQTYVALSRARTFDGLLLLRPLTPRDIFLSQEATGYRTRLKRLKL